jgi:hypothetical protein
MRVKEEAGTDFHVGVLGFRGFQVTRNGGELRLRKQWLGFWLKRSYFI